MRVEGRDWGSWECGSWEIVIIQIQGVDTELGMPTWEERDLVSG